MSRRRVAPRAAPPRQRTEIMVEKADGQWYVRPLRGSSAAKDYRCPGCDQLFSPAIAHTLAWPVEKALLSDSAIDERRHWHTACWARRH